MAPRKRATQSNRITPEDANAFIAGAGTMVEQQIVETLEKNYMPYAMSVIVSRAIPEIDGFKPSHRKLLYTMYDMGLLNGGRMKSANIVGRTMQLNPHGDAAIYETMVRLSRGYAALLHPFIDSKGNFGKAYSRDMMYAASRYTEAKLDPICAELFKDISKNTVDFVDNYDATMKEPTLLPVTFPSVLVNANTGIAVGMASSICPFNLEEVCRTAIKYIKNGRHDIMSTLLAPDFPGGGIILYDKNSMQSIYDTGRGSFKVRSVYSYDAKNNCIDVTEISDIRDETGLKGLKITIDLKRGTDPDRLMQKLFKMTTLEDSFACNFNVLIAGYPRVMGVRELLDEWLIFRTDCVRRRVKYDLEKAEAKLHLLKGLSKILLDIDKPIKIVRETESEDMEVPNLMIGFGIDEVQAEYIAEIKLRHLNREYILKRLEETEQLKSSIADMKDILDDNGRVQDIIIGELNEVIKKYSQPRRTQILYDFEELSDVEAEAAPDYPVHLFFTKYGYFKKITPQSLRMSGAQKLKEDDVIIQSYEANNNDELLFFTNKCQVYKSSAADFEDTKASVLGDYVASKLNMDEGETAIYMAPISKYTGYMLFIFENGKVAKVDIKSYETKTNRRKLIKAYSDKSPLAAAVYLPDGDAEILLTSSNSRMLLVHTGALTLKSTKDTQGVAVMTQKRGHRVASVKVYAEGMLANPHRYRTRTLPAAGALPDKEEKGEQLTL